jgi:hypothetical protein
VRKVLLVPTRQANWLHFVQPQAAGWHHIHLGQFTVLIESQGSALTRVNTDELKNRVMAHMKAAETFHDTLCYQSWHWHESEFRRMAGRKLLSAHHPPAMGTFPDRQK